MERSLLETIQLLGLDMMVAVTLLALVASAAVRLVAALAHQVGLLIRRNVPTELDLPGDAFAPQEWRPSR